MNQISRQSALPTNGAPQTSFNFLAVIREMHVVKRTGPSPNDDYLIVSLVSNPFEKEMGAAAASLAPRIKVYLRQKTPQSDNSALANSVHGLQFGHGTRPGISNDYVIALEKGIYNRAGGYIDAQFAKVGASPQARLDEMAIAYPSNWASVLPLRQVGGEIKQTAIILNPDAARPFSSFGEVEGLIDELRGVNTTKNGRSYGWLGFVVVSRKSPAGASEDELAKIASDVTSRLASCVVMTPRPSNRQGESSFIPLSSAEAVSLIDQGHIDGVRGDPHWCHEFIPLVGFPVAKTALPKVGSDGVKGLDRSTLYTFYDRHSGTGNIEKATVGIARSVVMAQCSNKTLSWIVSHAMPVASIPRIVPFQEIITPDMPVAHRRACLAEVERLHHIRLEFIASLAQRSTKSSTAGMSTRR